MPKYPPEIQEVVSRITGGFSPHIYCDRGWYPLIAACHKELLAIDPDYKVLQVKEKFGLLRIYFSTEKPELQKQMTDVVMKYAEISSTTCEITGKEGAGMHTRGYWVKTLHPDHAPEGYIPFVRKEAEVKP